MQRRLPLFILLLLSLCLTSAAPCLAQQPNQARVRPQPQPDPPRISQTINLDFPGGDAAMYLQAIRKAAGEVNIVAMSDLSRIQIPPTTLRNVDVWSAVRILESVPENQNGLNFAVDVSRETAPDPSQMDVFVVVAYLQRVGSDSQELRIFEMSDLLDEAIKPKDMLTAVENALDMLKGDYQPAQIRFHEETGLLIVRGHPIQVHTVQQIAEQLRSKAMYAQQARKNKDEMGSLQVRVDELTASLNKTNSIADQYKQQIAEHHAMVQGLQREIDRLAHEIERRDAAMQTLQQEIQAYRAKGSQP